MSSLLAGIRFVSKTEVDDRRSPGPSKTAELHGNHKRHRHEVEGHADSARRRQHKHRTHSHSGHKHKKERRRSLSNSNEVVHAIDKYKEDGSSASEGQQQDADEQSAEEAPPELITREQKRWLNPALGRRLHGGSPRNPIVGPAVDDTLSKISASERMGWMSATAPSSPTLLPSEPAAAITQHSSDLSLPPGLYIPGKSTEGIPSTGAQHFASSLQHTESHNVENLRVKLLRPMQTDQATPVMSGNTTPLDTPTASSLESNKASWRQRMGDKVRSLHTAPGGAVELAQVSAAGARWQKDNGCGTEVTAEAASASTDASLSLFPRGGPPPPPPPSHDSTSRREVTTTTLASEMNSSDDLNKLHARALRAQMLGDTTGYAAIMDKIQLASSSSVLQSGRSPFTEDDFHAPAAKRSRTDDTPESSEEVVSTLDERGLPIASLQPGYAAAPEKEDSRKGRWQGKRKLQVDKMDHEHEGAVGKRSAFVGEDNVDMSVVDMLRNERLQTSRALDDNLASNINKAGGKYRGAGFVGSKSGVDEDADEALEDIARLVDDPDRRLTAAAKQRKDMQRAVSSHKRAHMTEQNCWYCLESQHIKKHLIISLGEHSLLMLAPDGEKLPGHCLIVPLPHITSMTEADEEVYDEVNRFKAALHAMHEAAGNDVIFLETAMHRDKRRHAIVEAVPMEKELALDAPLFFRKEILEAEDWTSHKDLIDTTGKGLRKCVPKGFPYFHVSWKGGGFVHVIEEEADFPAAFGIDICAGIIGLPPGRWDRRGSKRKTFDEERAAVLKFIKDWEKYDWTTDLEGGS